jgi:hypothetical protein
VNDESRAGVAVVYVPEEGPFDGWHLRFESRLDGFERLVIQSQGISFPLRVLGDYPPPF